MIHNENMAKKQVTTEHLAVMVKRGFDDVTNRMTRGFQEVDKKFEGVDKKFDSMGKKLDVVDGRLLHLEASMNTLEHDVAEIRRHFVYHDEFEEALNRIMTIEKRLGIKSPR